MLASMDYNVSRPWETDHDPDNGTAISENVAVSNIWVSSIRLLEFIIMYASVKVVRLHATYKWENK